VQGHHLGPNSPSIEEGGILLIQTVPSVRLIPPSNFFGSKWLAEDILERKRFSIPRAGVLFLLACMRPLERDEAVRLVTKSTSLPEGPTSSVLESLENRGLILSPNEIDTNERLQNFENVRREWEDHSWIEAAEYHLSTYDYEYIGATEGALKEALGRMRHYSEIDPDLDRSKVYLSPIRRIPLPRPSADLAAQVECENKQSDNVTKKPMTKRSLEAVLSLTFVKTGTTETMWSGAPIILRTTPSGGGRNPTEGYLIALSVEGLEPGWYHISIEGSDLEFIQRGGVGPEEMENMFPATYGRAPFPVSAIVVFTSIFERNMFRYREPRTFRTIHMDAGHLASTLEIIARSLGMRVFTQYVANELAVEKTLGLNGMEEGLILSTALG
jgi:SagB-type dehydrogenase family enzyme